MTHLQLRDMIKKFVRQHQYKIAIGAPIIFLLIVGTSTGLGRGNFFLMSTPSGPFVVVGDSAEVNLEIYTNTPVNAVGALLRFPKDELEVQSISRATSLIDLWSEDPVYSNEKGEIKFSGGILNSRTDDAMRHGSIFVVTFKAIKTGKATLTIGDAQLLANDGEGTNVHTGSNEISLYVREQGKPSPDINADGVFTFNDVNALYRKTFGSYNAQYDMNGDGKLNWSDVKILLALL